MKKNGSFNSRNSSEPNEGITRIIVGGFKSVAQEQSVEIRPLTILAGVNSSGKSSIVQPLLLLKQTLEATYDPGAILLDGANLKFTSADQLFSRHGAKAEKEILVGFEIGGGLQISTFYRRSQEGAIDVERMRYSADSDQIEISNGMKSDDIINLFPLEARSHKVFASLKFAIVRVRSFLDIKVTDYSGDSTESFFKEFVAFLPGSIWKNMLFNARFAAFKSFFGQQALSIDQKINKILTEIIHIPGLRGNPSRAYRVMAVGSSYPGTFEEYTGTIINEWEESGNTELLTHLYQDLRSLDLTWKVTAKRINDTRVGLHVGRLPTPVRGGARDLVDIADVGFGVSQVLPVLVALHVARPGQLVYVEQPELHLHPRAQTAMAKVLINAARRGVRVVVETHSDLLLLGIQTEVAKGLLPADSVKLHWFSRLKKDGTTKITSADLDESGTFGDWPEDFSEVRLKAESDFLDSAFVPTKSEE